MSGKWMFRFWMTVGALCAASAAQSAPWSDLISLKHVDTDPAKPYTIAEENGPWMVMACTFSGDGAEKQAHELVLETAYSLQAAGLRLSWPLRSGEAQVRGVDKFGNKRKGDLLQVQGREEPGKSPTSRPRRGRRFGGQLSGGRRSESPGTAAHAQVRESQNALRSRMDIATHQTLTGWRLAQQQVYEMIGSSKKQLGPMRHSFIARIRCFRPSISTSGGLDEETIALNKGVPYNLLECPGKYTVQVATFKGQRRYPSGRHSRYLRTAGKRWAASWPSPPNKRTPWSRN